MLASVIEFDVAKAPHLVDPARRLRSGAWLLQRSWRHPHRLPAGWRSERFAHSVDRARQQLQPIRTLSALAESFAREAIHLTPESAKATAIEVAYATRWLELVGGRKLRDWRSLCRVATR